MEEGRGGFVGAALGAGQLRLGGDELAGEGFCKDGLGEFVGPRRRHRNVPLDGVRQGEKRVHTFDDFCELVCGC